MSDSHRLPTKELEWMRRQFAHPAPEYLISGLVRLGGPNATGMHRRLRRRLIGKGVIPKSVGKGREHVVSYSRMMAIWPDYWLSAKRAFRDAIGAEKDEDAAA